MTGPTPRVLVVEDSDGDVELLRAVFEDVLPDVELSIAWDGEQALAALLDRDRPPLPDLVLLDLNLPRVDGLEVLAAVRVAEDPLVRRVPIVVLTTSRASSDVDRAYERGANAYVSKPFDVDELLRTTRALVEFWFGAAHLPARRDG
jgi:two-component system response regulator